MKTQISVLVKGETMMAKMNANPLLGPFGLLKKNNIVMVLDGKQQELAERKEPYVFDVEPGEHQIQFLDPKKGNKELAKSIGKFTAGAIGFAVGGGSFGVAEGFADLVPGATIEGGAANVMLQEGDILKLSCQNTGNGIPKVKVLKK